MRGLYEDQLRQWKMAAASTRHVIINLGKPPLQVKNLLAEHFNIIMDLNPIDPRYLKSATTEAVKPNAQATESAPASSTRFIDPTKDFDEEDIILTPSSSVPKKTAPFTNGTLVTTPQITNHDRIPLGVSSSNTAPNPPLGAASSTVMAKNLLAPKRESFMISTGEDENRLLSEKSEQALQKRLGSRTPSHKMQAAWTPDAMPSQTSNTCLEGPTNKSAT